ncbi:hypothetical protein VD0004_g4683 [Verticillium dahliae]|uniref:CID domain-containing protein n=1 Tax=Verticillium dahliae TaxID=27337 RepID=A0A444S7U5_VERDA|nr:hypothetical protein VdG1_06666 [Verticillium dahliae VDG1]PNH42650.1 hypothetical protein VD0004_g4683 [Verticillium dahliae]RXG49469.1 hypothetical protein VDGE_06770 [Verticillium dahliae]
MSHNEQSGADVAEDYKQALEDLNSTNRADISTLTTIARENTEHAQIITDILQRHIIKAPAHKKLPAIYVLDSIVKNVGTPYTLFFGAQLFQTFMEAYAAVDGHVRRKMEETLQTWKQPVPQSLDDRPVFPPEVTKPIEESLNKARNSALALQAQGRGHPVGRARGAGIHRATPTPPGMRPGSSQPGYPGPPPHAQQQQLNGSRPPSVQQQQAPAPYPPPQAYGGLQPTAGAPTPFQASPSQHHSVNIAVLKHDIQELITASTLEAAQYPHDGVIKARLQGLHDLQRLLQTQDMPQDHLILIKNQVTDLALKVRPQSVPSSAPIAAATPVSYHPPPPAPVAHIAPQPASVTLDSLLGQGALASLLARQSATPQAQTPAPAPPPYAGMPIRSPQPPVAVPSRQPSAAPTPDPMALLAGLRMAGLLGGTPTTTPPVPTPIPNLPHPGLPLPSLGGVPPSPPPGGIPPPGAGIIPPNIASLLSGSNLPLSVRMMDQIQLNSTSLKQEFRAHLLPSLFDALGPQCTQCGRRFTKDEDGRKKKTAHMDWHFQVHHRLAEAERRGQHRSWYVDHSDWVASREVVDADHAKEAAEAAARQDSGAHGSGGAGGKGSSQVPYIAVPDASAGVNTTCPICQEEFENKWLDTAQEWVWLDAKLVGNRAYHASCHAEATMVRDATPARGTPEPVLGKRKAEDELKNARRLKMESA